MQIEVLHFNRGWMVLDNRKLCVAKIVYVAITEKNVSLVPKNEKGAATSMTNPLIIQWCRSRDLNPDRRTPTRP